MQFTVHLLAFNEEIPIPTRIVDTPEKQARALVASKSEGDRDILLEMVFYYGQNDFQPKPVRSVSCGDVVELPDGSLHMVLGSGYEHLPTGTDINTLPRGVLRV